MKKNKQKVEIKMPLWQMIHLYIYENQIPKYHYKRILQRYRIENTSELWEFAIN